jgi:L-fuconolactonase
MSSRIDSHQHFWKYDPKVFGWIPDSMNRIKRDFLPEDLRPILKKNNIGGCVAVQVVQNERESEFLLNLASKNAFIIAVVGWVDLSAPNVEERLNFFSRNPLFKGIRHTVYDEAGEFLLKPEFQNGISNLSDQNLTFDLLVFEYQLNSAIKLVEKFPNQAFVLDHLAKPDISKKISAEWKRKMAILAQNPNVYAKLSGFTTQTEDFRWKRDQFLPFLDTMFETFGPDRLMFGSDWPVCLSAGSYETGINILEDYLSGEAPGTVEKIFGGNAIGFYNNLAQKKSRSFKQDFNK